MVDQREYEARLAEAVNNRGIDVSAKILAVLRKEFGADVANRMMKQIAPVLKARGLGGRRESSIVTKMLALRSSKSAPAA